MKPRDDETFEPMRKQRGNTHPASLNKGRLKRRFKDARHLGKKRHR